MLSSQRIRGWLYILSLALLVPVSVKALEIRVLEITRNGDLYRVNFEVVIPVPPAGVQALLRDYRQWPKLSATMTESRLLETLPDGRQRVRVVFRSCFFLFCKDINQTKELDNHQEGDIRAVMVREQSDFTYGREHWQIRAVEGMTRVHYKAEFAPAFALPPVIGPWILKARLRQELRLTAERLETLNRDTVEPDQAWRNR